MYVYVCIYIYIYTYTHQHASTKKSPSRDVHAEILFRQMLCRTPFMLVILSDVPLVIRFGHESALKLSDVGISNVMSHGVLVPNVSGFDCDWCHVTCHSMILYSMAWIPWICVMKHGTVVVLLVCNKCGVRCHRDERGGNNAQHQA